MKKLLSALLIAIMLLSIAPMIGFDFDAVAVGATYKTGDIVEFGSYPQSKVTDSATLSKLNAVTKKWISYGYYSGTGDWFDGNMTPSDYMKYCDIKLDGNKYRAVTFSAYRPSQTDGLADTSAEFYTYQSRSGYKINTVYYFKYQPLKWRVLDASTGLVVCNNAIDSQAYNNYCLFSDPDCEHYGDSAKTYYVNNWEHSSLRAWLNDDFLNTAFTSSQQSKIKTATRENKSTYDNQYNSNPTSDKITLLSYWDALNTSYGFSSSSGICAARDIKSTDYAKCQGCYVPDSGNNSWWLRSPGYTPNVATVVSGCVVKRYYDSGGTANNTFIGVVPAFNFINLFNLQASNANTNKITTDKNINAIKQSSALTEATEKIEQSTTLAEQTDANEQSTTLAEQTETNEQSSVLAVKTAESTGESEQSSDNGKKKTIITSAVSLCLVAAIAAIVICIVKKFKSKP